MCAVLWGVADVVFCSSFAQCHLSPSLPTVYLKLTPPPADLSTSILSCWSLSLECWVWSNTPCTSLISPPPCKFHGRWEFGKLLFTKHIE